MNRGRVAAESRHNFHFLPHFNSNVTGQMFTKFLNDAEQYTLATHEGVAPFSMSISATEMWL